MAEVLEEVADGELSSSKAAEKRTELKKVGAEFMTRKKDFMKDISAEEGKALMKKYSKKSEEAFSRYMKAAAKLGKSGRMTQELQDAVKNLNDD